MRLSKQNGSRPAWLHPRWTAAEGDDCQRLPLSGVSVVNCAGQRTTVLRVSSAAATSSARPVAVDAITLPEDCQMTCVAPREIRLNGALPPTTIRAGLVISVENTAGLSAPRAIGGIYRDVACDLGDERQALLFATRNHDVFWLVPLTEGRWSLGLLSSRVEQPAEESLADVFEEALVACPALTQRLISAKLLGDLHVSPDCSSDTADLRGAIKVPEYEGWLDPVFASSDWLGTELASQVTLQLPAGADSLDERLRAWQQDWSAVEQLTSERIAPWYRLHDSLPAALHDHAQRTWYEKLLAGQRTR